MDEMEIKSSHSDACLRFYDFDRDKFFASYTHPECSGIVRVWLNRASETEELVGLFGSMAENWRGWPGEKKWSSAENQFAMTCTCDKLGHIALGVELSQFASWEPWRLRARVVVDAGQLEAIARDAKLFFKT